MNSRQRRKQKRELEQESEEQRLERLVLGQNDGLERYLYDKIKYINAHVPEHTFGYKIMCGYLGQPIGYKLLEDNQVLIRGACCLKDKHICEYIAPKETFIYDSISCPIYEKNVQPGIYRKSR